MAGRADRAGAGLDLVLPVHNEARTIEATIEEWLVAGADAGAPMRVVACEDGSTDGSREVLERLSRRLPVLVVGGAARKGYSQAVVDGLRSTTAPVVCCIDSDGQCDPADLVRLLREPGDAPVVVGIRSPRLDPPSRRAMSDLVKLLVRAAHGVRLEDPSCPFVVADGELARSVAAADPVLAQGYWWEFHIRLRNRGVDVAQVPVHHRERADGGSRVYLPRQLPQIAWTHAIGILRLRHAT